jgi:hypothetical protein
MLILVTHTNRQLHIPDSFFLLGDEAIVEAVGTISFFPVLVLAARICPRGVEGTLYALLMSVINFGSVISNEIGSALTHFLHISATDFTNLWILIIICSCCSLLPLPLLWILRVPNTDVDTIQGQQRLQHVHASDSDSQHPPPPSSSSSSSSSSLSDLENPPPVHPPVVNPPTESVLHNTVSFNTPIIPSRCLLPCKDNNPTASTSPSSTARHQGSSSCCQGTRDKTTDDYLDNSNHSDVPLEKTSSFSEKKKKLRLRTNASPHHSHGDLSDEETLRRYPPTSFPTSSITDQSEEDTTTTTAAGVRSSSEDLYLHLNLPERQEPKKEDP